MALTRILFASDFHGADVVWRKFLSACLTYRVDVAIVGGDVTGKALVPLVRQPGGGVRATVLGRTHEAKTDREVTELQRHLANMGFYTAVVEADEAERLAGDEDARNRLFARLMYEKVLHWLDLAEQHLRPRGIQLLFMAGNDDTEVVDEATARHEWVINPDGRVVHLRDGREAVGLAAANLTPWQCPRDLPEEELAARIARAAQDLRDPEGAVFVFHVPPYDSGLDMAPELDEGLRIRHAGGQVLLRPVGSTAVREAIERFQPLLSLHGHIHESPGFRRIGRTLCVNAGSEYAEGVLRAAVINLERYRVKGYLPLAG